MRISLTLLGILIFLTLLSSCSSRHVIKSKGSQRVVSSHVERTVKSATSESKEKATKVFASRGQLKLSKRALENTYKSEGDELDSLKVEVERRRVGDIPEEFWCPSGKVEKSSEEEVKVLGIQEVEIAGSKVSVCCVEMRVKEGKDVKKVLSCYTKDMQFILEKEFDPSSNSWRKTLEAFTSLSGERCIRIFHEDGKYEENCGTL